MIYNNLRSITAKLNLALLVNILFSQFQVSPMLIEHYIEHNQTGVSTIDIRNNKDKPLGLSLYLKDKSFIDGNPSEALPGTTPNSCADWIFFTPSVLNLGPKETQSIRLNIDVPDTAKGTCWSVLFIEEASPPNPKVREINGMKFNLAMNLRMGVMINQTVPGTSIKDGSVKSIDISYDVFNLQDPDQTNLRDEDLARYKLNLMNQPHIFSNWLCTKDENLKLKFNKIVLSKNLSDKLNYSSIGSNPGLIKLLRRIIQKEGDIFGENKNNKLTNEYYKLIDDIFNAIKLLESKVENKKTGYINFDYINTGNSISKCTGYVEFRDIDGLPVKKVELDDIPKIYPAEKRQFQVPIPNNLETGEYSALAVIDFGGSQLVAGEILFEFEKPKNGN